jgi:hypothetical protein
MKRTLDFNALEQPSIELTFRDAARTRVTVKAPTTAMVEKLQANLGSIKAALGGDQATALPAVYDMLAEFISCNEEGLTVTGADLRDKYGWTDIIYPFAFMKVYLEMIEEIQNAKN